MFKQLTLAAMACTLGLLAAAMPAEAGVNKRQARQEARVNQGVNSGSLNRREAARLRRNQHNIARYEARSRADGGGLSRRERANIARMQNNSSRRIRRQKHDRQR